MPDTHAISAPPRPGERVAGVRVLSLLIGSAGLALLAAWLPLLDRDGGLWVLKTLDDSRIVAGLPAWLLGLSLAAIALGGLGAMVSLWRDSRLRLGLGWSGRWLSSHPWWSAVLLLAAVAGAVDVYELMYDPLTRTPGLRVWMLREDVQSWLFWSAAVLGGLAVSAASPGSERLSRLTDQVCKSIRERSGWWWLVAAGTPLVLATAMCAIALEGIPHFSDSLTYLMQGRILHDGRLWLTSPKHHDLFQHSLFFIETDGRFYGKYPIGWPAILGTFDRLGVGFAANAVMASLAAILTGLIARRFTTPRVAVIAAVLFGLSPWVWFNGSGFASHVSSTCAVMAFMWLFLCALEGGGAWAAIGAGLALGAAVLIRPFDAAAFALPAVFVVLWQQIRNPRRWIPLGLLVAAGAMVGVGVYLWVNSQTVGSAMSSAYAQEARWDKDWNPAPLSMLARFGFQWSELSSRVPGWGVSGLTVAVLGAIAAGPRWKTTGLKLLCASTVVFLLGSTAFGFTNVWWGPRWLFPVTPLLAILAAELIERVITQLLPPMTGEIKHRGASAAAEMAVCVLLAGLVVGLAARYTAVFYRHRLTPPHMVSAAVHEEVTRQGLDHPVVAMPPIGPRAPLDARAGMAFMSVPFEDNEVIYVRAVDQWRQKASECFPGRDLYEIRPESGNPRGFVIEAASIQ